jgi:class 3 adenylate cyclase/tetratricopeptide (TPR) repeat protein
MTTANDPAKAGRTVTMVFSDLAGSTALGEQLDPETLRQLLDRYFDEMRAVLSARGGVIEKIIGDAIVAVFDDDNPVVGAVAAVRAVTETHSALDVLNEVIESRWGVRLANRTGVATGALQAERLEAGHSILGGEVVDLAESLERASPHLEALFDTATRTLVGEEATWEGFGEVPVKGSDGATLEAHRLLALPAETEASAGTGSGVTSCTACGAELDAHARRCSACGAYVRASRDTRRTVSVVFADPKPAAGSAQVDSGVMTDVMAAFFSTARDVLEQHGATVETFIGDAVMAVFGLPVRREDDAVRAVRAAADIRASVARLNEDFEERYGITLDCPIGVNTGEVVAGDAALGQRLVTGDVVNVAARLEQSAAGDEILIGALTERLVRGALVTSPVEPLTLKGKSEPVPAFRYEGIVSTGADHQDRRLPMVGREEELDTLLGSFRAAVETSAATLVSLFGDAGVGKSTLLREFTQMVREGGGRSVGGRCLPYGDGITFWPIVEITWKLAGIDDDTAPQEARVAILRLADGDGDVADRIGSILGLVDESFGVSEIFWAVRRLFETVAATQPLVVVFEDVHWAEQTLLDLVDHLNETATASVALVCAARPSMTDRYPDWGTRENESLVVLEPLSDEDIARIIDNVLGGAGIGDLARSRVAQAAEGNPLFVEQMVSMMIDDGRLRHDGDRWVASDDLAELAIPPSIHALLAARIDRLPGPARAVVDPASVIGKTFAQGAIRHLVPDEEVLRELGSHLAELIRRQMVILTEDDDVDSVYRFQHALLRDAAYQGLLKETRAVFHEEFVRWADRVNEEAGRGQEFEEILGFHLEQAFRYWSDLGPVDEHVRSLGTDGAIRLASAGNRARDRGDMPAAASLLGRAAALFDIGDPRLGEVLLRTAQARFEVGDFDGARAAITRAAEVAEEQDDAGAAVAAELELFGVDYLTGAATSAVDDVRERCREFASRLSEYGHEAGLARAWRLIATVEVVAGQFGDAERASLRMVDHAARAGDEVMQLRMLQTIAALAPVGPTPVPAAIERCIEILARTEADRRAAANTSKGLATLYAMIGDTEQARRLCREARSTLAELGWRYDAALVSLESSQVEFLAGDPAVAETELRSDYEALKEMGDAFFLPTIAVYLAEALVRQGRYDEAAEFAAETAQTADPDDVAPQSMWRTIRARIDAAQGRADEAVPLAREAVEIMERSDGPVLLAGSLMGLAEVARLAGDEPTALEAAGRARTLFESKGCSVGVEQVGAFVTG